MKTRQLKSHSLLAAILLVLITCMSMVPSITAYAAFDPQLEIGSQIMGSSNVADVLPTDPILGGHVSYSLSGTVGTITIHDLPAGTTYSYGNDWPFIYWKSFSDLSSLVIIFDNCPSLTLIGTTAQSAFVQLEDEKTVHLKSDGNITFATGNTDYAIRSSMVPSSVIFSGNSSDNAGCFTSYVPIYAGNFELRNTYIGTENGYIVTSLDKSFTLNGGNLNIDVNSPTTFNGAIHCRDFVYSSGSISIQGRNFALSEAPTNTLVNLTRESTASNYAFIISPNGNDTSTSDRYYDGDTINTATLNKTKKLQSGLKSTLPGSANKEYGLTNPFDINIKLDDAFLLTPDSFSVMIKNADDTLEATDKYTVSGKTVTISKDLFNSLSLGDTLDILIFGKGNYGNKLSLTTVTVVEHATEPLPEPDPSQNNDGTAITPNTSDSNNLTLIISILGFAAVCMTGFIYKAKKTK